MVSILYYGAGKPARSWTLNCCLMPYLFLWNPQHMIADAVRMIRHCQSEQPGQSLQPSADLCCDWNHKSSSGNACDTFSGLYCHLELDAFITLAFAQFPSNHFQTVDFFPLPFQATRWSGWTAQRCERAFNTCTLSTISRHFSSCRTSWSHVRESTGSARGGRLNATCRTLARSPYQQRCLMFCRSETFKQSRLLLKRFYTSKQDLRKSCK